VRSINRRTSATNGDGALASDGGAGEARIQGVGKMKATRSGARIVVAFALVGVGGCRIDLGEGLEDLVEQLELEEPMEAQVQMDGVDAASVRAGLFAASSTGEIVASDGTSAQGDVDLDVDWGDGRVDAYLPGGGSSVSVEPLQAAEIDGDDVVFTLPSLSADTGLVAVIWVDEDGDGALDLSVDGESEAARTIVRDYEGTPHYLAHYSYDAAEGVYSATAVGDDNGTISNLVIGDDQVADWDATLDRATDDPR
jgi:hypothetical protein